MPYRYYEKRLETFETWPKQMVPDKYALAKSGFVYTGQGDKVKCFQCGVGVNDWERTDDPWTEHRKWSSNCEYLKMIGGGQTVPNNKPKLLFGKDVTGQAENGELMKRFTFGDSPGTKEVAARKPWGVSYETRPLGINTKSSLF